MVVGVFCMPGQVQISGKRGVTCIVVLKQTVEIIILIFEHSRIIKANLWLINKVIKLFASLFKWSLRYA